MDICTEETGRAALMTARAETGSSAHGLRTPLFVHFPLRIKTHHCKKCVCGCVLAYVLACNLSVCACVCAGECRCVFVSACMCQVLITSFKRHDDTVRARVAFS